MIDTVIFDFNGTLYFDQDLNRDSWKIIYKDILGTEDGFEAQLETILATNDATNIDNFYKSIGKNVPRETLDELSNKKEELYRSLAYKNNRNTLAPGADKLLDYLKDNNYKLYLATASIKSNVDFYFDYCGLSKWIDRNNVAYDDGVNKNKYEMYKKMIDLSNSDINNILVFDDSSGSVNSALKAGVKHLIRVNHYNYKHVDSEYITQEIYDFTGLDYSIFK